MERKHFVKKYLDFKSLFQFFFLVNRHITLIESDTRIDKYKKNDVFGLKPN